MKKLVTVMWSSTVLMELPEEIGLDELTTWDATGSVQSLAESAITQAYNQIECSDGEITEVSQP